VSGGLALTVTPLPHGCAVHAPLQRVVAGMNMNPHSGEVPDFLVSLCFALAAACFIVWLYTMLHP